MSANNLSAATVSSARAGVRLPRYDRATVAPGIVHFGPGAFHRAHQAAYVDDVLADDPRWGIVDVALNSTSVADALRPQDGLYTLALLGACPEYRIVGSIIEFLNRHNAELIAARLAAPATRLVTATVTEKGYCLAADGELDFAHPAIVRDLSGAMPVTLVGWLVRGLAIRRAAGSGGLTILSCDNLAANGRRLGRAVATFAAASDPDLARWIADMVRFPASMVDSITPATDDALRARVTAATGLEDAWPIQREGFAQWVIEDDFAGERPPLAAAGAQIVGSVTAFEDAKLRLLNGAHSSIAYIGLLLGHETVRDAMDDPTLADFVGRLMRLDIAPSLGAAPDLDVPVYIDQILDRFRNPAIRHLLSQIAWDGSQKLPFRLLATIEDAADAGRPLDRLTVPIAAWFRFLARARPPADALVDPLAARLIALAGDVDALIERSGVFSDPLIGNPAFRRAVHAAWETMTDEAGVRAAL